MALPLKPRHLPRYRDIARLLIKYGRRDLLRGSGIDELGPDDAAMPRTITRERFVHRRGGEILEKQERKQEEARHGRNGGAGSAESTKSQAYV